MANGAPRRCAAHQYSSQQCELYEVSEIPAAVKVKQFIQSHMRTVLLVRTRFENITTKFQTTLISALGQIIIRNHTLIRCVVLSLALKLGPQARLASTSEM